MLATATKGGRGATQQRRQLYVQVEPDGSGAGLGVSWAGLGQAGRHACTPAPTHQLPPRPPPPPPTHQTCGGWTR